MMRSRRSRRFTAAVIAAVAGAGCAADPAGVAPDGDTVIGEFALVRVNGRTLPFAGYTDAILDGKIRFLESGLFVDELALHSTRTFDWHAGLGNAGRVTSGYFRELGPRVELRYAGDRLAPVDTITVDGSLLVKLRCGSTALCPAEFAELTFEYARR